MHSFFSCSRLLNAEPVYTLCEMVKLKYTRNFMEGSYKGGVLRLGLLQMS
jgi:hypothetical protein